MYEILDIASNLGQKLGKRGKLMKKCILFRKVYTKPVNDGSPNTDKNSPGN